MKAEIFYTDISNSGFESFEGNDAALRLAAGLSEYRQRKIRRYSYDKARLQALEAGLLLDYCLRRYGLRERGMRIGFGERGKPYFLDFPDLHFNLSHSGPLAMAAFSDFELGCDIQMLRKADLRLVDRFFSREEADLIHSFKEGEERDRHFCDTWTLKESFVKATGEGLGRQLDSFCVLPGQRPENYCFYSWQIPGASAAVCVAGERKGSGQMEPELVFCPFQTLADMV